MRLSIRPITNHILLGAAVLASVSAAYGQTLDGSIIGDESFYGAALSTQPTQTGYGNAAGGDLTITPGSGGSEINQVFGTVANGRLYVMITGNLEPNFNKLNVFIDSEAGGVNTIDGDNLPQNVDGFCCGSTGPSDPSTDGALQRMDGLTFDAGFDADHYLAFSNGVENVNGRDSGGVPPAVDPDESQFDFWAINAHYADLTQGASGDVVRAGIQIAPQGLPQALRNPTDYNRDGTVDTADYTVWRDSFGQTGDDLPADSNADGVVNEVDYTNWFFQFNNDASLGTAASFLASADFPTQAQVNADVTLPGLSQGQLIDSVYALGAGGCTNNEGDGCVAEELEFVLDEAADETDNGSNHRLFTNSIDLELGFDNSNEAGVDGGSGDAAAGAAETATTGLEFSIPLSEIGNPTGDIRVLAFIGNGGFDFVSNQFSGAGITADAGLGLTQNNLDQSLFNDGPDPPLFTLDLIPGDQFVTITAPSVTAVPEPTAAGLAALGLLLVSRWRRR